MQLFVILFSFSFSLIAIELNYLQLSTLRSQHSFSQHNRGHTSLYLNSSKRFYELYSVSSEDEIDKLNKEVRDAYKSPYKTHIALDQVIKYEELIFKLSFQDSLIVEINNPVFPEAKIFNIRSDSLSIQRTFHFFNIEMLTSLSLFNRWYIDKTYSLKDIITDEVALDLHNGKTYSPIYLDLFLQKNENKNYYSLDISSIDLFQNDKYSYSNSELSFLRKFSKTFIGLSTPLLYEGDYLIEDKLSLLINYEFNSKFQLVSQISSINKNISLNYLSSKFSFDAGYEMINRTAISDDYIENFFIKLSILY